MPPNIGKRDLKISLTMLDNILKKLGIILVGSGLLSFLTTVIYVSAVSGENQEMVWLAGLFCILVSICGVVIYKKGQLLNPLIDENEGSMNDMDKREEKIQAEIRRRILKEAQRKEGARNLAETTKATLDALEQMIDLPREEMEKIAQKVCDEFNVGFTPKLDSQPPPAKGKKTFDTFVSPWTSAFFLLMTLYLIRRGSYWYLLSGLLLLICIVNLIIKFKSKNNND